MGRHLFTHITAPRLELNANFRKLISMRLNKSYVCNRNVLFQYDWSKLRLLSLPVNAIHEICQCHVDPGAQHGSGLLDGMRTILADKNDVVRRAIIGNHALEPVIDSTSRCYQGNLSHAILFGALFVIIRLGDLMIPE